MPVCIQTSQLYQDIPEIGCQPVYQRVLLLVVQGVSKLNIGHSLHNADHSSAGGI